MGKIRTHALLVAVLAFPTSCRTTAGRIAVGSVGTVGVVGGGTAYLTSSTSWNSYLGGLSLVTGLVLLAIAGSPDELASGGGSYAGGNSYAGGGATGASSPTSEARGAGAMPRQPAGGYDANGTYAGRRDASGNYYDANGTQAGRVDSSGNYYDASGASAGRHDDNGNVYDRNGTAAGRIDAQGNLYDASGAPAGRIDASGNLYDRNGAQAGRLDGACDDACKRDAAGRILLQH